MPLKKYTFSDLCGNARNAPPVITSGAAELSFTEIADRRPGENTIVHRSTAPIAFADADTGNVHSVRVVPAASGQSYLGTFTLGPIDQANHVFDWTFQVRDSEVDFLQAGQVLIQHYDVIVSDGNGGTATQTVTVRLTGTNDAPVITSPVTGARIVELTDASANENALTHQRGGRITFTDADTLDTHTARVAPAASGYLGTFTLGAVDQAGNALTWNFSVPDSVLESLGAGQVLTQVYKVTVDDGHGGTAVQDVTVRIYGTNDGPVITSPVTGARIVELTDASTNENAFTHQRGGRITFTDADTLDTHTARVAPATSGYLGTFTLGPVDQAVNALTWNFSVPDSVLESLGAGQVLTQVYKVTVSDGRGGTAVQDVTVRIYGTNDAPVADDEVNTTREDTPLSVPASSGVLVGDTDVDGGPLKVVTFQVHDGAVMRAGQTANIPGIGTLKINADGSYTFVPAPHYNGPVPVATYTVSDGFGGTDTGTLTINVTPVNDPVKISGLNVNIAEHVVLENDLADGSSPNAAGLTKTGSFSVSAVDGLGSIVIGGVTVATAAGLTATRVVDSPLGKLTVTGFTPLVDAAGKVAGATVTYSYLLQENSLAHTFPGADHGVFENFALLVTDADGSSASGSIDVQIVDDIVTAHNEPTATIGEGSVLHGQFDFTPGADGAVTIAINAVTLVFGSDGYSQPITGAHGQLQVKADGTYRYTSQADDLYRNGGSDTFTFNVRDGDGDTAGGQFTVIVKDDKDAPVLTLDDIAVPEGSGTAAITAHLSHAPMATPLVVTLSNGAQITFAVGQTTATSTPFAIQGDDVYKDASTAIVSIANASGGNFEHLNLTDTAAVTVADTLNIVTATLTASSPGLDEYGGTITYTITLMGSPGSFAPLGDLVFQLAGGESITIPAGATAGSLTRTFADADITNETAITNSVVSFTGGAEYELLIAEGTTSIAVGGKDDECSCGHDHDHHHDGCGDDDDTHDDDHYSGDDNYSGDGDDGHTHDSDCGHEVPPPPVTSDDSCPPDDADDHGSDPYSAASSEACEAQTSSVDACAPPEDAWYQADSLTYPDSPQGDPSHTDAEVCAVLDAYDGSGMDAAYTASAGDCTCALEHMSRSPAGTDDFNL